MYDFSRKSLAIASICLALPTLSFAQFEGFSGGEAKPWQGLLPASKVMVQPKLIRVSVDRIVSYYQNISGITIIRDPALTGLMSIASAKPVTVAEAFDILAANLSLRGFEINAKAGMLVVKKKVSGKGQAAAVTASPGMNQEGPGRFPPGPSEAQETLVLRVYRIRFANASALAQTLNDVLGQAAGNGSMPNFGGPAGGGGGPTFGAPGGGPPSRSPQGATTDGRPQGFAVQGGGGQGGPNQGGPGGFAGGPQVTPNTTSTPGPAYRAAADDFSNSIILYAPERIQEQVKSLIEQLDRQTNASQTTKVYKLLYANASETEAIVQGVLNANVPKGKAGATTQQNQGPAAMIRAASGGVAGAGQVASDTRTNSLIVTASDENLKVLDDVIPLLDKQVLISASVFIFPMNFAQSDHIAALLQQALGQKQGTGSSTNPAPSTGNTNNNNNQGGPGGGGAGG